MNKIVDILTTLMLIGGGFGFGYLITNHEPFFATICGIISISAIILRFYLRKREFERIT